jgi:N-acyl-phosphatidylethanolamine-hydrolysing phospholipase D
MSGVAVAPLLYAATVSSPVLQPAEPSEAKDKAHHAKNGKGFVNPWPSWKNWTPMQIVPQMAW